MPKETQEHFDAEGNYTGKTIVTRESEWNAYTRSRVYALLAYEGRKCPNCGNFDTLEPVSKDPIRVRWDDFGRRIEVAQYRCITCASTAAVRRAWIEEHENDKPVPGQAAPADGLMFMATPTTYEEV